MSLMSLKEWMDKYGNDIVCLVITTKLPSSESNILEVLKMFKNSGFIYPFFKVFTNKILPIYYKFSNKYTGVENYLKNKIPSINVIHADNVNDEKIINEIKKYNPEVILSFSATTRFSDDLIKIPSRVCVNAHYAILPAYAGLSPYYWYLHNSENLCGCTFHKISTQLDAGDIIESKNFSMKGINSVMSVLLKQIDLISPMLINFYNGNTSEFNTIKQDLSKRTYYRHPSKNDITGFYERERVFFDRKSLSIFLKGIKR